jgi:molybdopterin molybdotransferase
MIQLERARELAEEHTVFAGTESILLEESLNRVLAEDVLADRDIPPFSRSTMDGYACRREDLPGPLKVLETIEAGALPGRRVGLGQCSKIMTGAMIPDGSDCVILKEYVKEAAKDSIMFTASETDTNIDPRGQDLKEGELLLQKGTWINAGHTGILASAGKTRIEATCVLNVGILATGSELVEAGKRPEGAQIRNSNSYQLAAQVRRSGHTPVDFGMVEDKADRIANRISDALKEVNILLLTGGASVGELDLVPAVLRDLGFVLEFDRVAMQPGKPVSFAHGKGKACFGLSGNPVSSFVQFEMLVRPYLGACTGKAPVNRRIRIRMEGEYQRKRADRKFFLPVCFTDEGSCEPVVYHGSGHLHALHRAVGFAEMPAGQTVIKKGDQVYVRLI